MLFELLTARYPGMRQWLMQRLSATLMALYLLLLVLRVLMLSPTGFTQWQAFFAPLWWCALTWLFFALMLLHAWIGVRDVLRDYVSHFKSKNSVTTFGGCITVGGFDLDKPNLVEYIKGTSINSISVAIRRCS